MLREKSNFEKFSPYFLPTLIIILLLSLLSWLTVPTPKFKKDQCLKIAAPGDHNDFLNGRVHYYKVVDTNLYDYALELYHTNQEGELLSLDRTMMNIRNVDGSARPIPCP